jgi:hypothetical protein
MSHLGQRSGVTPDGTATLPRMPAQTEHPEKPSAMADVEQALAAKIGDHALLANDCEELRKLLAPDERLLDVAPMSLKGSRFGVLAITDRRLLHVHVRDVFSGSRIAEIDYHNVRRVHAETWRSLAELRVDLKKRQRMLLLPSRRAAFNLLHGPGSAERVKELATCLRNAVSRVQEPVKPVPLTLKRVG